MEEIINSAPYGPIQLAELQFDTTLISRKMPKINSYTWTFIGLVAVTVTSTIIISTCINHYNDKIKDVDT